MRVDKPTPVEVQEYAAFLAAEPVTPQRATDEAVYRLVENSLRPGLWPVLGKVTLVQAAAGLGTLSLCPQFDIGFGGHHAGLHLLHAWTGPLLHYLACGIVFVLFGALLAGLLLNRQERQTLGRRKHLFSLAYSLVAFGIFVGLGANVFFLTSLLWIAGVVLGNHLGLALGTKLRTAWS